MSEVDQVAAAPAVVTGASRGIGRALAVGLARSGRDIIGVARTESALDDLGAEVEGMGRRFHALPADLSDTGSISALASAAWEWQGSVGTLVNTAGMIFRTPTLEITPDEWDEIFGLNVKSTFFLTQKVAARMLANGGGNVVNIASLAAQVVTGASVSYAATKAAVVQMTKVLAVRFAPKVRVNAVGPGYVRTSLSAEWLEDSDNNSYVLDHTPLGRVGNVDDVVGAVVFLSSAEAGFVTGQHLLVDGGWSTQ